MDEGAAARARFDPRSKRGHYESWFVRANHPTRPIGLWFRYTVFAPRGGDATAELWGIWFDGETGAHAAERIDVPLGATRLPDRGALDVVIGDAALRRDAASGALRRPASGDVLAWSLSIDGQRGPELLLPPSLYDGPFPRAKSLILTPNARFDGRVTVRGAPKEVDGWRGSVNHNWGPAHTDAYAWCQVMGFDEAPESWLEIITGDVKVAGLSLPRSTLALLHHEGRTFRFDSIARGALAVARYDVGRYDARCESEAATIDVRFVGRREDFVGLPYRNPPGGVKVCHNSKIARADVVLAERGGRVVHLTSRCRAAFEVLLDEPRVPLAF